MENDIENEIFISAQGRLKTLDGKLFSQGNGDGLLRLIREKSGAKLSPGRSFFRRLGMNLVARLCRQAESDAADWPSAWVGARSTVESMALFLMEAPPLTGGENLSPELLLELENDLGAALEQEFDKARNKAEAGADSISVNEFIRFINPVWKDVGKVSFHLAENKNDPTGALPFAFLATFIHKISESGVPRHLPLGSALKTFLGDKKSLAALLAPIQAAAKVSPLIDQLLESKRIFSPCALSAGQAYQFIRDSEAIEQANIVVRYANLWKAAPPKAVVSVKLNLQNKKGDALGVDKLLSFSVQVVLDGQELTPEELQDLLDCSDGLIRVRGEWVQTDSEKLKQLLDQWDNAQQLSEETGLTMAQGLRLLAGGSLPGQGAPSGAALDLDLESDSLRIEASGSLQKLLDDLSQPGEIPVPALPTTLDQTLRSYQRDGIKYLWRVTSAGLGACLADDMGLGKTIQLLAILSLLKRSGGLKSGPALLVVPATLLGNWKSESARFTPELRLGILHASAMDKADWERLKTDPLPILRSFDAVLTTYGALMRTESLRKQKYPMVVIDEAQAIKNAAAKQSKAVRELKTDRRIALTGTPIENSLADLWSLFDFINPGLLGSAQTFTRYIKRLNSDSETSDYRPLRRLIKPFILRRLKTDKSIISDLPDKTELKAYCRLTKPQAILYEKAVRNMKRDIEQKDDTKRRGIIFQYLVQFKQICNHPSQFDGLGAYTPEKSGKFERLAELIEPIRARQEKLIVFTQFREMTEPIEEYLSGLFGQSGLILHGSTPIKQRSKLVEQFQSEDGPPFFVLSLKAAGTGLNLTAANHVVHFDRWWNPAVENQATDRAFRIGQKRNVLVHKFVCKGTLEERIDDMITQKQALADDLLSDGAEKLLTSMSNEELLDFVHLDMKKIED